MRIRNHTKFVFFRLPFLLGKFDSWQSPGGSPARRPPFHDYYVECFFSYMTATFKATVCVGQSVHLFYHPTFFCQPLISFLHHRSCPKVWLVFFSTAWTRYGVVFDWGLIRYLWGVIWIHCWFLRTLHWSQDEQTCHSCHESYEYEDWDQILSSVRQRDSFRCSRQSVSRQSEVGESAVGESAHNQNDPGSQSWLEFFYISSTFSDCDCLSVE